MPVYSLTDLFAGCGGMTRGFEDTKRFRSMFAVEWDVRAAATYRLNFGDHVIASPIEEVEHFPATDVLVGGPPCQGFSPLNMRGVGLERRALWREYLRALAQSAPLVFVMENVPGLLRSGEYAAFVREASLLGYDVEGDVLNAADYGVPQTRRRAIVIGSRIGPVCWPEQTHRPVTEGESRGRSWRTFGEAVKGLSAKPDGKKWHNPRNPRPVSLERYRAIPGEGEGRFDLARRRPDITPPCWLRKRSGSTDVFGRLWWDRPAYTIRTEFYKPEKGRYLHPKEHRPITVREAARCMSFTDDFVFPTNQAMTTVAKQIGNAVPPLLALAVAKALVKMLDGAISDAPSKASAVAA